MTSPTLDHTRQVAADAAFERFNFGSDRTVTDTDGWTRDGIYWSRWVYGDDPEGTDGRFRVSFGVEFAPDGDTIVEQWAQK